MHIKISSFLLTFTVFANLRLVQPHPTDIQPTTNQQKKSESNGKSSFPPDSRFMISLKPDVGRVTSVGSSISPFNILRQRRSLAFLGKRDSNQASKEMQTLLSGNWHRMDPESLFGLLASIASKEKFNDNYYNDEDDFIPAIDLVYYGKKPKSVLAHSPAMRVSKPDADTISLMSSGIGNSMAIISDYGESENNSPLSLLTNKIPNPNYFSSYLNPQSFSKRSPILNKSPLFANGPKFLGGEIAVSAIHGPRPPPLNFDDGLPIIQRRIL